MRRALVSLALPLLLAAQALAAPQKVVIDHEGERLDDVAVILENRKVDGWSPAKGAIERLTIVVSVPVVSTPSGHALGDRVIVAQSERGSRASLTWTGKIARQKAKEGLRPVARLAPHVLVLDHPCNVDAAQTEENLRLFVHVDRQTGELATFVLWRGALHRLPEGGIITNRLVVDEASFFIPTKTHTDGLAFGGEHIRDLSAAERSLLDAPARAPERTVALLDALRLPGEARARARAALSAP